MIDQPHSTLLERTTCLCGNLQTTLDKGGPKLVEAPLDDGSGLVNCRHDDKNVVLKTDGIKVLPGAIAENWRVAELRDGQGTTAMVVEDLSKV